MLRYWRKVKVHGFCLFSPLKSINANYVINETSYQNIFVLEHSRDQKAALCQTASQSISKWLRKDGTDKQTDKHFSIYISGDLYTYL